VGETNLLAPAADLGKSVSCQDIVVMMDQANSKVNGAKTRSKRGSIVIGSETDMNTEHFFVDKKVEQQQNDENGFDSTDVVFTCRKGLKATAPNQDSYVVARTDSFSIYAVFDGHGSDGHFVSNYVKNTLPRLIMQNDSFSDRSKRSDLLKSCFVQAQAMIEKKHSEKQFNASLAGCTSTVVLHDHELSKLWVAHVGDSGCCLGKKGPDGTFAKALTQDHKPDDPEEKKRVEEAGAVITYDGVNHRIFAKGKPYPGMNMTRALGDILAHKEAGVIAEPTVAEVPITAEDDLLLLCSDGVWEFLDCDQVVACVDKEETLKAGVDALAKLSWDSWMREEEESYSDDITIIAVKLSSATLTAESA